MVARLLNNGQSYSSFSFDQFWMFPQILALAFRIFRDSLGVGRAVVVAFSLIGLLGMAVLARQLGAGLLAAVAVLVGVTEPYYLAQSRVALSDVPGVACIVWALVCMAQFCWEDRRRWLWLSGALTAAALVIKPLTVVFAGVIGAWLILHRMRWRDHRLELQFSALCWDAVAFASPGILVAAPFVNLFDPAGEVHRTVFAHWLESRHDAPAMIRRLHGLLDFLARTFMWLPFVVAGILSAPRTARSLAIALVTGELGSAVLLLQFPPWPNHYTLLSPVLTVLAVVGMSRAVVTLKQRFKAGRDDSGEFSGDRPNKFLAMTVSFGAGIWLISVPWLGYNNLEVLNEPANDLTGLKAYLQHHSAPQTFWLSDNAIIPYSANRLMPPSAINLAFPRTFQAYATGRDELEKVINHNAIAGIALTSPNPLDPKLVSWIRTQFPIAKVVPGDSLETTAHVFTRK